MTTFINASLSIQMMPDEVEYIETLIEELPENGAITEWGSGGSTLHWLRLLKPTQRLYSVEHDLAWYDHILKLTEGYSNFKYYFANVNTEHFSHTYGTANEENPFATANYVYPSIDAFKSDVFIIDGIARGACLSTIMLHRHMNPHARIFIHDYMPRQLAYNWITQFYNVTQVGTTLVEIV